MRIQPVPLPVVTRRIASRVTGATAVAAAALLVAGCVAGPAGTATPGPTGTPPAPTVSANPIASLLATEPATQPATPSPSPTATPTTQPTAIPAATATAAPARTAPPPVPTRAPTPRPPTPRPTRPPTPAPTAAPQGRGTVEGLAHAGPTCPVAKYPPDPACADKPVAGIAIVVTDASGAIVATVTTGADGRFSVALPAGTYTLAPQPREGLLRTPGPETVTLAAGAAVTVDFAYDTGIR